MLEALGNIVECFICMDIMDSEIRQCERGHSICDACAKMVNSCPLCKSSMTSARNYKLEDVIANLKEMDKKYIFAGCEKKLDQSNVDHFPKFFHSNCDDLCDITNRHKPTKIELNAWNTLAVDQTTKDCFDIQLVAYGKGNQLFWYKHKINVHKQEVYWLFQYLEPRAKTSNCYYELTLSHELSRTLKMWELCEGESKSMDYLIDAGKCITIPFKILKNYLREDLKIYFKFNIVEIKEFENFDENMNQIAANISRDTQVLPPYNKHINEVGPSFSGNFNAPPLIFLPDTKELESSNNQNLNRLMDIHNSPTLHLAVHDLNATENREYNYPRFIPSPVSNNFNNRILDLAINSSDNQTPLNTNFQPNQQMQHHPTSADSANIYNVFGLPPRYQRRTPFAKRRHPIPAASSEEEEEEELPLELVVRKRKHFKEHTMQRCKQFHMVQDTVIDLTDTDTDSSDTVIDLTNEI